MKDAEITQVLRDVGSSPEEAADLLLPSVYGELRRLAAAKLARESGEQTLQATALVHEVWLRLGGDQQNAWANRAHFFHAAAEGMRRILIEKARRRQAVRHGGKLIRCSADATGFDLEAPSDDDEEVLIVHEALGALEEHDARKGEIVRQRYFAGLTLEETAEVLGISISTAHREWTYARTWLRSEINRLRE